MQNLDQDKGDQRISSDMEDSNAMTIEFLRARLLSERSVSKTARQRADELAKRVAELEEQLRIVALQRKKAEKATADVLAILESHGVSDVSESYYSSSDQEATPRKLKVCNGSSKGGESSVSSKQLGNESEEFSGTEFDSTASGGNLSWKGRKDASRSLGKYKDTSIRRRTSLGTMSSSSKHRPGKSCRQIRHKDQRLESSEVMNGSAKVDAQENDDAKSSETCQDLSETGCEVFRDDPELHLEKEVSDRPVSGRVENEGNVVVSGILENNDDRGERDMERALEHQAQLIGQYEAMEKAQRDWEEKFRENNSSTPDSCDPGNHSDITEERDEIKHQAPYAPLGVAMETVESKLGAEDASTDNKLLGTQPESFHQGLQPGVESAESQKYSIPVDKPPNQEHMSSTSSRKGKQENLASNYSPGQNHHNMGYGDSQGKQSAHGFSPSASDTSHKVEALRNQAEHYALVPRGAAGAHGVLDSLKQAKLLLQNKMTRMPVSDCGPLQITSKPPVYKTDIGDKMDIPGECPGLFRVPTDFSLDAAKANLLGSGSRLGLAGTYPETGVVLSTNNRSLSSRYLESRPSFFGDDRYISSPFTEGGSRMIFPRPSFDPYLDHRVPSSYATYPPYSFHPETISGMPSSEGFPRTLSGSTGSTSHPDPFLLHGGPSQPYMYR
ncbi:uncharacterized protein LOC115750038 [Rhodamnia argentea]|uniref:Uncharacterized protein LOC115750038 n=1 Tax=Rhodamnia argentea TaxID=178133 RepID=A0A8B8Q9W3_9MYRT|nr:uncharacterized protein LOC115750038 [Rhodamnia argentea]XP_030543042.1 uncharacterized protein LOC115750038 [Rhodamnia argentea]XP_030543053.1 uncharacterized protein LOC115750038 [Rhodamnia argentea]